MKKDNIKYPDQHLILYTKCKSQNYGRAAVLYQLETVLRIIGPVVYA